MKLISIIFFLPQSRFRGNSGTMDNVPTGINFWLFTHLVLPGGAILIFYWLYLKEKEKLKNQKELRLRKEKEKIRGEEERQKEKIKKKRDVAEKKILDEQRKKLNGIYEESDVTLELYIELEEYFFEDDEKVKIPIQKTYLNINEVKENVASINRASEIAKKWLFYHDLTLKKKRILKKHLLNGIVNIRDTNGYIEKTINYLEGEEIYSTYYNSSGEPKQGVWESKYDNGQLCSEVEYLDGKKHGIERTWYNNGQIEYEFFFKEGVSHGIRRRWYENGNLNHEMTFALGKEHGVYKFFNDDGHLRFEWKYVNGKKVN